MPQLPIMSRSYKRCDSLAHRSLVSGLKTPARQLHATITLRGEPTLLQHMSGSPDVMVRGATGVELAPEMEQVVCSIPQCLRVHAGAVHSPSKSSGRLCLQEVTQQLDLAE